MNIIDRFEQENIANLTANKMIHAFKAGNTVKVTVKIIDRSVEKDGKEKESKDFKLMKMWLLLEETEVLPLRY